MVNKNRLRQSLTYEIRVKGNLGPEWSAWFDGFTIAPQDNEETILVGQVADQPALHGLLAKIQNLGLTLVRVEQQS